MKVTTNRLPNRCCPLCGERLVPGTPGAQFSFSLGQVIRVHPACGSRLHRASRALHSPPT